MSARDEFAPAGSNACLPVALWGPMCDEIDRLRLEDERMTAALGDFMREQTRLQKQVAYREEEISRLQAAMVEVLRR